MFSPELIQLSVMFMMALAAGGVVYVLVIPFLSGERKTNKRFKSVAAPEAHRARRAVAAADATQQNRRRQVQETLKDLEEKKKATKKKRTMRTRLIQAGLTITPNTFYILSAVCGLFCYAFALLSGANMIVAALAGLVGIIGIPRKLVSIATKRRNRKFLAEFANALDIIVRGVKSGLPLNDCLQIIANEAAEPVRSEFAELCEQQRVGIPLAQCIEKMYERVELAEVNFFAIVIAIQQQAGGNLAEALSNLSQVLRDRKKLQGKVQAFSSEAKSSAAIIGSLPFLVTLMVYVTTPQYISLLWEDKLGNLMLVFSGFWMLCGIFIMRKMINFDY